MAVERRDAGATSTEYALVAGLIAVAITIAVAAVGQVTLELFEGLVTGMGW